MRAPAEHDILQQICAEAGQTALNYWLKSAARRKSDGSVVTNADEACEQTIVAALTRAFPDCSIVSEEGTNVTGDDRTWFVDPIDGTSSFVEGLAHWGPTIALLDNGRFVLGAFWQPRLGDFWFAKANEGAWYNGERLPSVNPDKIRSTDPFYGPSGIHRFDPIPWPGKFRALGATAAHLALVAANPGGIAIVPRWELWDVGNGILMVEETGGVLTDLQGNAWHPIQNRGTPFLAGSPRSIDTFLQRQTRS